MTRVLVLTTGGTIAMQHDPSLGGATPKMGAAELSSALPDELTESIELEIDEIVNLPSSHFTLDTLWQIRQAVVGALTRPEIDGVVITPSSIPWGLLEHSTMIAETNSGRYVFNCQSSAR